MPFSNSKIAGALLFVGGAQFIIFLIISEAIFPGYSISANYISDLGVWSMPSAAVFNPSIMFLGLTVIASSYFVSKAFRSHAIPVLLALAGLGSLLVGIFPESAVSVTVYELHDYVSFFAFIVGGLSAISFYKITQGPFRYLTVIFGALTLLAFVLFSTTSQYNYLGLGNGGMERMIAYPTIISTIGFGGYLLGITEK